jgi:NAD(P)-dependent dehydrogenase (short-subunit alcohol dehydrogenase family)
VAIAFAKEGADIVASYLNEHDDAKHTQQRVEALGQKCLLVPGDISQSNHCQHIIDIALKTFDKIDILVNHAGEQYQTNDMSDITDESLQRIFEVNVFSMFYLTRAALKYMKENTAIINTVSIVAYEGNPLLLDYTATKAAAVGFTRALAQALVKKNIRVNGVAPGPIWTPLIPASFDAEKVAKFGSQTPMERAGEPYELAPAYVFLANSVDSSYITGQVIHVNGGKIING